MKMPMGCCLSSNAKRPPKTRGWEPNPPERQGPKNSNHHHHLPGRKAGTRPWTLASRMWARDAATVDHTFVKAEPKGPPNSASLVRNEHAHHSSASPSLPHIVRPSSSKPAAGSSSGGVAPLHVRLDSDVQSPSRTSHRGCPPNGGEILPRQRSPQRVTSKADSVAIPAWPTIGELSS